ncbi:hypothetical protein ACFYKX_11665 [Cytobacillus sp. FJAT-54145]|uniref:Uncharacterized protein n=1 Tax=Cytobacillus spartinae TaxID=3299023 RepID=A0ABW6KAS0_9BACI
MHSLIQSDVQHFLPIMEAHTGIKFQKINVTEFADLTTHPEIPLFLASLQPYPANPLALSAQAPFYGTIGFEADPQLQSSILSYHHHKVGLKTVCKDLFLHVTGILAKQRQQMMSFHILPVLSGEATILSEGIGMSFFSEQGVCTLFFLDGFQWTQEGEMTRG